MMRFNCILFTIYFYWCKLYRSRSKALYVGLFRAIPSYTLLMQAEMPQIRVVAVIRVTPPIRLSYGRLVCPKRSSPWQSIGRDSRMRPLSNSAGCPDAMDPERGSVGSGAVVALYRTVAGRVPVWKCRAGTFWGNQGLTGALRLRWLLPSLTAQFRAAALGVRRCIGYYLRKRSCRHTAAYGSLSLSVCVATLPYSGSTHRHSQGLQCFLSRSPTLSGSFQKNLKPS